MWFVETDSKILNGNNIGVMPYIPASHNVLYLLVNWLG